LQLHVEKGKFPGAAMLTGMALWGRIAGVCPNYALALLRCVLQATLSPNAASIEQVRGERTPGRPVDTDNPRSFLVNQLVTVGTQHALTHGTMPSPGIVLNQK
jgi:hypothetical protein